MDTYGSYTKLRNQIYNRANRDEQANDVLHCARQNPNTLSRQIEVDSGVKRSTVLRILKKT